jgi:serine/threonine protein kinase
MPLYEGGDVYSLI